MLIGLKKTLEATNRLPPSEVDGRTEHAHEQEGLAAADDIVQALLSSPLPPRGIGLSKESARTIAAAVDDSKDLAKRAAAAARKRAKRAAKTLAEAPQLAFDSLKQQVRVSCSMRDRL